MFKFNRDYGLPDSRVKSPPVVMGPQEGQCPNCHGKTLFKIQIEVEQPLLKGGTGLGAYIGCAACPYASPMTSVSQRVSQ